MAQPIEGSKAENKKNLREVALLFLRLGTTAFGGPAAHIALMEEEVVARRKWMGRREFLDLVGATNLIPGPNSTELAIHIGKLRAGWPGLLAAGVCFILPAFCIVLALAFLYRNYGAVPQAQWLLRGVQPVVVAIVAQALWKFAATALYNGRSRMVAFLALALTFIGQSEFVVLGLAAVCGLALGAFETWRNRGKLAGTSGDEDALSSTRHSAEAASRRLDDDESKSATSDATTLRRAPLLLLVPAVPLAALPLAAAPVAAGLFWTFLKIGAVLYGSGYVLLAFLQREFVPHALSQKQLIDAIAIGQMTPGPVFTTATFVGYQLGGWSGAVAATVGIFLPSFLFVALLSIVMERLKASPLMRGFLEAVTAASLALMGWVTWLLARAAITDVATVLLAIVSLILLLGTRLNPTWLLIGGAVAGWLLKS